MSGSDELIFCDDCNVNLNYIEVANQGIGTFDSDQGMVLLIDKIPEVPTARPPYIAENIANKQDDLSNPNSTGYTSTLAVYNAIQSVITGDTGYTFEGSGATSVVSTHLSGTTHTIIYSPTADTRVFDSGNTTFISIDSTTNFSVGYGALSGNTTGYNNTAIGCQALCGNTTGYNNFAVGYQALRANIIGNNNFAVGYRTLYNNTGYSNIAIGCEALCGNTTGGSNFAAGSSALRANTSGNANVGIGTVTLRNNTTGCNNFAVGYGALQQNNTGCNNVAVGCLALYKNICGHNNFAVGYQALYNNSYGKYNTAIGCQTLFYNTTGCENFAVGNRALYCNKSGCDNIAIGGGALFTNLYGKCNVAIGNSAGFNETGSNKLFIANNQTTNLIYGDFTQNCVVLPTLKLCNTPEAGSSDDGVLAWNSTDKKVKVITVQTNKRVEVDSLPINNMSLPFSIAGVPQKARFFPKIIDYIGLFLFEFYSVADEEVFGTDLFFNNETEFNNWVDDNYDYDYGTIIIKCYYSESQSTPMMNALKGRNFAYSVIKGKNRYYRASYKTINHSYSDIHWGNRDSFIASIFLDFLGLTISSNYRTYGGAIWFPRNQKRLYNHHRDDLSPADYIEVFDNTSSKSVINDVGTMVTVDNIRPTQMEIIESKFYKFNKDVYPATFSVVVNNDKPYDFIRHDSIIKVYRIKDSVSGYQAFFVKPVGVDSFYLNSPGAEQVTNVIAKSVGTDSQPIYSVVTDTEFGSSSAQSDVNFWFPKNGDLLRKLAPKTFLTNPAKVGMNDVSFMLNFGNGIFSKQSNKMKLVPYKAGVSLQIRI